MAHSQQNVGVSCVCSKCLTEPAISIYPTPYIPVLISRGADRNRCNQGWCIISKAGTQLSNWIIGSLQLSIPISESFLSCADGSQTQGQQGKFRSQG